MGARWIGLSPAVAADHESRRDCWLVTPPAAAGRDFWFVGIPATRTRLPLRRKGQRRRGAGAAARLFRIQSASGGEHAAAASSPSGRAATAP